MAVSVVQVVTAGPQGPPGSPGSPGSTDHHALSNLTTGNDHTQYVLKVGDIITSLDPANIPLVLKGAASQTANLQEWRNSAGTTLTRVDKSGNITIFNPGTTNPTFQASSTNGGSGNGSTVYMKSYDGGANRGTLYVENALGGGTQFGGTGGTTPYEVQISNSSITNTALIVKGFASQTADLQQWQNSTGVKLLKVTSAGAITGDTGSPTLTFGTDGSAVLGPLRILTTALSFTDSVSSSFFQMQANSLFTATSGLVMTRFGLGSQSVVVADGAYNAIPPPAANSLLNVVSLTATRTPIIAKGFTSQTADLQQWQDSTAAVKARVDPSGNFSGNSFIVNNSTGVSFGSRTNNVAQIGNRLTIGGYLPPGGVTTQMLTMQAGLPTYVGIIVAAAASQTADLQQWTDSAGAIIANVTATGDLKASNFATTGNGTITGFRFTAPGNGQVNIGSTSVAGLAVIAGAGSGSAVATVDGFASNANSVPFVVKGAGTQTAEMTRWQTQTGTSLSKIRASGEYENMVSAVSASDAGGGQGGIVLTSPNGTRYRVTVADDGVVTTVAA